MISVCILTKNSSATLAATLASLTSFPEVIVLDTGSSDNTLQIATAFANVAIHAAPFTGFGPLRNQAAALATHDWILALDSDEVLTEPLQRELRELSLEPQTVYEIDFHNYYNGKRILGCGWHPESHVRLYNRQTTRFSDAAVHEGVLTQGHRVVCLGHPICHTPYRSISDFLAKMQHYSDLFAAQHRGQKSSFRKALGHGLGAFFKSYVLKRGVFVGKEGFLISFYNGSTAFFKYLKLSEK